MCCCTSNACLVHAVVSCELSNSSHTAANRCLQELEAEKAALDDAAALLEAELLDVQLNLAGTMKNAADSSGLSICVNHLPPVLLAVGSFCFCCLVANACYCGLTVGTAADDCVEGELLEARLGLAAAKKASDDQLQGAKSSYVSHVS